MNKGKLLYTNVAADILRRDQLGVRNAGDSNDNGDTTQIRQCHAEGAQTATNEKVNSGQADQSNNNCQTKRYRLPRTMVDKTNYYSTVKWHLRRAMTKSSQWLRWTIDMVLVKNPG